MSPLILSAIISLIVASLSGFITSYITLSIERKRLRIDLKKAYAVELFKKRLESYSPVWEALEDLSAQAAMPINDKRADQVSQKLNKWLYSIGGMCAHMVTRRAVLDVRNACIDFSEGKISIEEVREFRDTAMKYLRRDLDIRGLESFDEEDSPKVEELVTRP